MAGACRRGRPPPLPRETAQQGHRGAQRNPAAGAQAFAPSGRRHLRSGGGGSGKGAKPMMAAARRFGGTGPRAYRRVLTPSGGSTTSGNGGAQAATAPPTAAASIPHAPTVSAASYRHAAEVGALFIGPPLFPAFGVVVADVFDALLLVFVLQHPVGRVALFCGARRANRVTFGDPRAVRFRMAAPA